MSYYVSLVGLEPTRPFGHQALDLARLPFRHSDMCAIDRIRTCPGATPQASQACASAKFATMACRVLLRDPNGIRTRIDKLESLAS